MAAKTPAPCDPKVPDGMGVFGARKQPDGKYLFGTEAEILNRNATGYNTSPSETPPSFAQIRPGPSSADANSPSPQARSGNSKFGNPRRYA